MCFFPLMKRNLHIWENIYQMWSGLPWYACYSEYSSSIGSYLRRLCSSLPLGGRELEASHHRLPGMATAEAATGNLQMRSIPNKACPVSNCHIIDKISPLHSTPTAASFDSFLNCLSLLKNPSGEDLASTLSHECPRSARNRGAQRFAMGVVRKG